MPPTVFYSAQVRRQKRTGWKKRDLKQKKKKGIMTETARETCSISYVQRKRHFILHWNAEHCKIDNCHAVEQAQSFVNMLLVESNWIICKKGSDWIIVSFFIYKTGGVAPYWTFIKMNLKVCIMLHFFGLAMNQCFCALRGGNLHYPLIIWVCS